MAALVLGVSVATAASREPQLADSAACRCKDELVANHCKKYI
jgi:hypothetical protein